VVGGRDRRIARKSAQDLKLTHYPAAGDTAKWAESAERARGRDATRLADALIAATALMHHLRLATRNLQHFTPIEGLQVEKPYD
jgi:predicted nucleic acid-binding protein